jgi:hypothetical protein
MENNIELRSEKVRNIIGKMPPALIRYGIEIFTAIFILLFVGSYCFKFTPIGNINADIKITPSDATVILYLPPSVRKEVTIGNQVMVDFSSLSGKRDDKLFVTITHIAKKMTVSEKGAYYTAETSLNEESKKWIDNLFFEDFVMLRAEVFFEKTSVFQYIITLMFK